MLAAFFAPSSKKIDAPSRERNISVTDFPFGSRACAPFPSEAGGRRGGRIRARYL